GAGRARGGRGAPPMSAVALPKHEARRTISPMPSGLLQRRCSCGGTPGPDGECAACRAKRLRRQAAGSRTELAPPIVHDVLRSPGRRPRVSSASAVLRRTCREHPNRSYYESAANYCRDTPATGQLHPGQQCFREVPRRSSYLDCPAADQVCFDAQGGCHDSWDEASPVESKNPDGTCNLHFACSLAHAWKDKVIQTWLDQQLEELGRRQLECVRTCEG